MISSVTTDLDPCGYGPPPPPPYQTFLLASFVSYLVPNSICKLFVNVLFNHNTAFLSNDKDKQLFRSNSTAFIIASRTVYARMKCEQTTEFELLKLLP